jgi:hypothetical protein
MVNVVFLVPSTSSRLIMMFDFPGGPFNSISMYPFFLVCFTNEFKSWRPRTLIINGVREKTHIFEPTHTRRKIKSETNSASNAALSRAVRADNHVQVRAGTEFNKVIGDEVLELNAHNGSCNISLTVLDVAREV